MGRKGGARTGRARWRWPFPVLVVALMIVGHDVLMAGNAHAAPAHPLPSISSQADTQRHAEAGERAESATEREECGTAPAAARRRLDPDPEDALAASSVERSAWATTATAIAAAVAPPPLPSRTRRALLQVYRV